MKTLPEHWDEIFRKTDECKLGWHEDDFSQSFKFFNLIPNWENSKIFIAGVGTSALIEHLLKAGVTRLVLNDLSVEAIEKNKNKHKHKHIDSSAQIHWLNCDISNPLPSEINDIDIWFDRAVLHFLVEDDSIEQYFRNVNAAVKVGGYAIFAEFSKTGATKCAGLDLRRYDIKDLKDKLDSFELIANEEYTYVNPNGDPRPYIYSLFKRKS